MRRLAGLVLVAAGVALLARLLLAPSLEAHRTALEQTRLAEQVPAGAAPAGRSRIPVAQPVDTGEALASLHIPRLGGKWRWVAVEGTGAGELALGPGHYAGTALPGQRGNSGFAAHRAGHGDPFLDFDQLRPGDLVVIEQGDVQWTYRLDTAPRIVMPEDTWVLSPAAGRRLTLTTCWPKYGSSKRMYVSGALTEVARISGGSGWRPVWTTTSDRRAAA